jgi:hypothetical protein
MRVRPPDVLLADLVRQPSARVQAAMIGRLLVHSGVRLSCLLL